MHYFVYMSAMFKDALCFSADFSLRIPILSLSRPLRSQCVSFFLTHSYTHLHLAKDHSQLMCQSNNITAWVWGIHVSWVRGRRGPRTGPRRGVRGTQASRMCVCMSVCSFRGVGHGGMAGIVMQEEKVRQCKVFVVLMQGEDSCSERSDAAAAPAWKRVCRTARGGQLFIDPHPPPPLHPIPACS